jgi:cardiolipin synthase (CMP-forming)
MEAVSTRPLRPHTFALPNVLTYARIAAAPAVAACLYWQGALGGDTWLRWLALILFIAAALTDFFDGYLARVRGQQSAIGRMLDPIADKLLVACCLLMLVADHTIRGAALWAALLILFREILISGMREYLAGVAVSVPVTRLAKWKTTIQLVAIGFLLAGSAGDAIVPGVTATGVLLLWAAAAVTAYTGWEYFRSSVRHLIKE